MPDASNGRDSALDSFGFHVAIIGVASLAVCASYGVLDAPISFDQAYFTYMAQALLRGEALYSQTMYAYPPLGPMVSAASMAVGEPFGMATYLAPRFLAVGLGIVAEIAVYAVVRRATGSGWAGLVAALALAGSQRLSVSYLSTLQPKHLVVVFTLLGCAACQRRRWGIAGFLGGLIVSSYLPALLVAAGFGVVAGWTLLRERSAVPLRYAAGFVIGLFPALVYLVATDGMDGFWLRAIDAPSAARLTRVGATPGHWIDVLVRRYAADLWFLSAGALGCVGFSVQSWLRRRRRALDVWLSPEFGAMPALAVLWSLSATLEFQGHPDAYPLLPVAAFWAGWLAHQLTTHSFVQEVFRTRLQRRGRNALAASSLAIVAIVSFHDVPGHERTYGLTQQLELVRGIWDAEGVTPRSVVASSAEEVYALAERPSPYPFLRLPALLLPYLHHVGIDGCAGVLKSIRGQRPRVVVLRIRPSAGGCEPRIAKLLGQTGYTRAPKQLGLFVFRRAADERVSQPRQLSR